MDWVVGFVDCPGLVFLDSALRHESLGRYSFIAADPAHRLVARGAETAIDGVPFAGSPFDAIERLLAMHSVEQVPDLPPFQTGWAGQFGYGLRRHLEAVPDHGRSDHGFPDLELGWYDVVVAVDHRERRAFVLAGGDRAAARTEWALSRLDRKAGFAPPAWEIEPEPDLTADQHRRDAQAWLAKASRNRTKPPSATRARNVLSPAGICGSAALAVRRRVDTVVILQ
jgi:para-aminobenzoate synthetase component 1